NSGTEYGQMIRNLFVAPEGHTLVVADYSQIEPRLIAGFSRDPVMMQNYHDGGDLYMTVAEKMGLDRKAGKVLVLSIAYGVGPDNLSKQIGVDYDQAKELLKDFNDKFPRVELLKKRVVRQALQREVPYVSTPAGRRRYLPELTSDTFWMRLRAERQAFNTLIQGTAADTMKMALIAVSDQISDSAYITLTVHDEVVVVTPDALADQTAEAVRAGMEGAALPGIGVPLLAEVTIADRWGEAK
ncbi:MAG: DNA polymerase A family protein, partial [Roseovarius sp.]